MQHNSQAARATHRELPFSTTMHRAQSADESALIARLRRGEESAFAQLVDAYQGAMVALAMRYVARAEVAEEIVQETWCAVLRGIHHFEGRASLKTWIFTILVNRAKNVGKKERRIRDVSTDHDSILGENNAFFISPSYQAIRGSASQLGQQMTTSGPLLEEVILYRELCATALQAIADLPPTQRAVITLRAIEGRSADEVCQALNLTSENQRVLLHRARSSVQRVISQYLPL